MRDLYDQPHIVLVGGKGDLSGVPRHICHLVSALREDAQVSVISDENEGGYDALPTLGATHHIVPGLATRFSFRHIWRGWAGLLKSLRSTQPDLIWLHAPFPILMARLAIALRLWRPNCRVVFTYHGLAFATGHKPLIRKTSSILERVLLTLCPHHHIVFLTNSMATRALQLLGPRWFQKHTTHVLPNCASLSTSHRSKTPSARHLIMTGRACRQKDHKRAFELFAMLPNDTRLTLCGPETDSTQFQKLCASILPKQALERVTFVGPVSDVRPYLEKADAYLLTSRYEGLPIGALEAFEAGLPIILSDFDRAADLVDLHPCALLLSKTDTKKNAAKIVELIDRFRSHQPALQAKTHAVWQAHWSPEVFAKHHRSFVQTILNTTA